MGRHQVSGHSGLSARHITPTVGRPRHTVNQRTTHEAAAFSEVLTSAEPAQIQEAQRDVVFGTQNFLEGSVTLDKMRLEDEFGSTILTPSGFEGSWEDTILTGIYNGAFNDNNPTEIDALISGRTSSVPYWTVTLSGGATGTASVGGVSAKLYATGHGLELVTDKIKVRQNQRYRVMLIERYNTSNDITRTVSVNRYERGAFVDNLTTDSVTFTTTEAIALRSVGSFMSSDSPDVVTAETTECEIKINFAWVSGTNSSVNAVTVYEVQLIPEPYNKGSKFPSHPTDGAREYDTENGMWWKYDGTRWLCECAHSIDLGLWGGTPGTPISATTVAYRRAAVPWFATGVADLYLLKYNVSFYVAGGGTALSASHKWVGQLTGLQRDTNATQTNLGSTVDVDFGDSAEVRNFALTLNIDLNGGTIHDILSTNWTKTGTPGTFQAYESVSYRFKGS